MNTSDNEFKYQMQKVLFYLFVTVFSLTCILTIFALFFDVGSLDKKTKDLLSKTMIGEVTVGVLCLFYSVFGIKKRIGIESENKGDTAFKEYISMFLGLVEKKAYLLFLLGIISGVIISYSLFVYGFGQSVPAEPVKLSLGLERTIESLKKVHIKTNRELLDLKRNGSIEEFNASQKVFLSKQDEIEDKKILDTFQQHSYELESMIQSWHDALMISEKEIVKQYNTASTVNRAITDLLVSLSHPKDIDDVEAMVIMWRTVEGQD